MEAKTTRPANPNAQPFLANWRFWAAVVIAVMIIAPIAWMLYPQIVLNRTLEELEAARSEYREITSLYDFYRDKNDSLENLLAMNADLVGQMKRYADDHNLALQNTRANLAGLMQGGSPPPAETAATQAPPADTATRQALTDSDTNAEPADGVVTSENNGGRATEAKPPAAPGANWVMFVDVLKNSKYKLTAHLDFRGMNRREVALAIYTDGKRIGDKRITLPDEARTRVGEQFALTEPLEEHNSYSIIIETAPDYKREFQFIYSNGALYVY